MSSDDNTTNPTTSPPSNPTIGARVLADWVRESTSAMQSMRTSVFAQSFTKIWIDQGAASQELTLGDLARVVSDPAHGAHISSIRLSDLIMGCVDHELAKREPIKAETEEPEAETAAPSKSSSKKASKKAAKAKAEADSETEEAPKRRGKASIPGEVTAAQAKILVAAKSPIRLDAAMKASGIEGDNAKDLTRSILRSLVEEGKLKKAGAGPATTYQVA